MAVLLLLGACASFPYPGAPTAWIGKDTPEGVQEGAFPRLSDVPDRPETLSPAERDAVARALEAERRRLEAARREEERRHGENVSAEEAAASSADL